MPAAAQDFPLDAVVAIIRRGDRFLFVRRSSRQPAAGYWCPVSGRLEPGESQAQALRREVREELGAEAVAVARLGEVVTNDGHYRLHYWRTELRGEPRLTGGEATALRWCTVPELGVLEPTFEDDVRICADELAAHGG